MRVLRMAVLLAACSMAPAAACVRPGKTTTAEPTTYVRVENQALQDATVYVWDSSTRLRIGNVGSLSTQTMRIPSSAIFGPSSLRFQVDFLAGNRPALTESIMVVPGDTVVLQIPPQ